jgi:hypothetical protein
VPVLCGYGNACRSALRVCERLSVAENRETLKYSFPALSATTLVGPASFIKEAMWLQEQPPPECPASPVYMRQDKVTTSKRKHQAVIAGSRLFDLDLDLDVVKFLL